MRWSGRALTEREREVFPVPDGPITRSIGSLIDNDSERGADDKGFAKDGVWEADRWDRSLLTGSAAEVTAAAFRACLST